MRKIDVYLAKPRGFCAGVERAIEIVEKAIKKYGAPVYVRHEIVHNKYVVDKLKKEGAIFVNEISEIPEGSVTIFSAHGVSEKVEIEAKSIHLSVIDATCPLVKKVHIEAQKMERNHKQIILIGHKGHAEVEGTSGRVKQDIILVQNVEDVNNLNIDPSTELAYVTQTTLSVDDTKNIISALKAKFPNIEGPDINDICYATQNRQNAVRDLSEKSDVILVIGAKNSSNSNRLKDLSEECGVKSYLINNSTDINMKWFEGISSIGITAGASAPEVLLDEVLDFLKNNFYITINEMEGVEENIKFKIPTILTA